MAYVSTEQGLRETSVGLDDPTISIDDQVISTLPQKVIGKFTEREDGVKGIVGKLADSPRVDNIIYDRELTPKQKRIRLFELISQKVHDPRKQLYVFQQIVGHYDDIHYAGFDSDDDNYHGDHHVGFDSGKDLNLNATQHLQLDDMHLPEIAQVDLLGIGYGYPAMAPSPS